MCAAPAGGAGSRVQLAPPSVVATSSPLPSAQPWSAETKLTSCTSIGPAAWTLGGAETGGLVAAGAEALTEVDGAVDDGTEPGLDDAQPASATSAASAAAVTQKRLFMSLRTPNSSVRLHSGPGAGSPPPSMVAAER